MKPNFNNSFSPKKSKTELIKNSQINEGFNETQKSSTNNITSRSSNTSK